MVAIKSSGIPQGIKIVPVYQQIPKDSGYALTYTLTKLSNGEFSPEFDPANIQKTRPTKVTTADGKAIYSDAYPHMENNRITVDKIDGATITLSAIPHSSYTCDIQIHFYYTIVSGGMVKDYFYNGALLNTANEDSYTADGKYTVDVVNYFTGVDIDTDETLGANSDKKVPSQKAVREFVKNAVTVLWNDRGNHDASTGKYPESGGSGRSGGIRKGDIWTISVAGTLGDIYSHVGDTLRAIVDSPGQDPQNWISTESNLGYTAVSTARTVNGNPLSSDVTLVLASQDFKNQGTTSTVLHGNEDGNPVFAPVNLASDVTGILPPDSFPELSGDILTIPGSVKTAVAANAVTSEKFRQSTARSVVGNPTNTRNNVTDIQGTANQVLRVDENGISLSFGQVNLSKSEAVTGVLRKESMPGLTGDITSASGSVGTRIGEGKVTNAMLAGEIAAKKLIGKDIDTVGTITSGAWQAETISLAKGGTGHTKAHAAKDALTVQSVDIRSSAITDLAQTTGDYVVITGATPIKSFGDMPAGIERVLKFSEKLTLHYDPGILLLPGEEDIITAKDDRAIMRSLGSGKWLCIAYIRATAAPVSGKNTGDQEFHLESDVVGSGTGKIKTTIMQNAVTSEKFRKSAPVSIVGNSLAIPSNVTDITGTANQILRIEEDGKSLGFGKINISNPDSVTGVLQESSMPALRGDVATTKGNLATVIQENAVTFGKIAKISPMSLVGNSSTSTNILAEITGTASQVMRIDNSGNSLGFGAIDLSKKSAAIGILQASSFPVLSGDVVNPEGSTKITITDNSVSDRKIRKSKGLSVIGNSSAEEGGVADISGKEGQVLRVGKEKLGFGAIDISNPEAATGILQAKSFPALTGDITSPSGSLTTSIGTGRVKNDMLAGGISSSKFIGNDISVVGKIKDGAWEASTIAAKFGGTGYSSYKVGDLLFADTESSLGKLADVERGSVLISGGESAAPVWGKIGLKTHVEGVLPVMNGGTNSAIALNNNRVMISSKGAIVESAAAKNGEILIGSTGAAPAFATITPGYGTMITNGPSSIIPAVSLTHAQISLSEPETTTSTMDISLATPITGNLIAGTYLMFFSCSIGANTTTAASTTISLYTGATLKTATQYPGTERMIKNGSGGQGSSLVESIFFQTVLNLSKDTVYDIRWRCSAGVSSIFNRQLTLVRIA